MQIRSIWTERSLVGNSWEKSPPLTGIGDGQSTMNAGNNHKFIFYYFKKASLTSLRREYETDSIPSLVSSRVRYPTVAEVIPESLLGNRPALVALFPQTEFIE